MNATSTPAPQPTTKLVEIRLSAITRMEYTETVEVPIGITAAQLSDLAHRRYDTVGAGEFKEDADYWERGDCFAVDAEAPISEPTVKVTIDNEGGLDIREMPTARYVVADNWSHIFIGRNDSNTRWVFDTQLNTLLTAQLQSGNKWDELRGYTRADLLESIQQNDVIQDFEDNGLTATNELPQWAPAAAQPDESGTAESRPDRQRG